MASIQEGLAILDIETHSTISRELPVFYNPVMKLNRDVTIHILNAMDKKYHCCEPLAGSGIRGIRLLLECTNIASMTINDADENAYQSMHTNAQLNKLTLIENQYAPKESEQLTLRIFNKDANTLLQDSNGFDFIDIDPFGSPNQHLAHAIERLARKGILAVTATDTGALSGTYRNACIRKYWAQPLRNELKHEVGLRILIRKVQMMGAHVEKALIPIYSYATDHYMRVFFTCEKGKEKVDAIMKQHMYLLHNVATSEITFSKENHKEECTMAGPLWVGDLWDKELAQKITHNCSEESQELLTTIAQEAKIQTVGFYDIHAFAKRYKLGKQPRNEELRTVIQHKGYKVKPTHFSKTGIRTDMPFSELKDLILEMSK